MVETIIWFIVSVPVLSVLMALVAPSVSTSDRFLTTAFASASFRAPWDSRADTNAGMPVGMAEIAIATPRSRTSDSGSPRKSPTTTITATAVQATMPMTDVSLSSSCCSGDRVRVTDDSMLAICPIWVCMPVAVTTMTPVPRVTDVFWNSMFVRSPSAASAVSRVATPFATGALSPVRAASCVSQVAERISRPSAGTRSPASTWTMSPGTTSSAGMSTSWPSRTTRLCGTCSLESASTLARAVISWRVPRVRLRTTRRATTRAVENSPMTRLTIATATSMRFIGSRSWPRAMDTTDGGFSPLMLFGP